MCFYPGLLVASFFFKEMWLFHELVKCYTKYFIPLICIFVSSHHSEDTQKQHHHQQLLGREMKVNRKYNQTVKLVKCSSLNSEL